MVVILECGRPEWSGRGRGKLNVNVCGLGGG